MRKLTEFKFLGQLLSDSDLKAANGTNYDTEFMDLRKYDTFSLHLNTDVTGAAAAGVASLKVLVFDDNKVSFKTYNLLTAIDTTADRTEHVNWSKYFAAAKTGNGTIGTQVDQLRVGLGWVKFRLTVDTQSDAATSNVADLFLLAS